MIKRLIIRRKKTYQAATPSPVLAGGNVIQDSRKHSRAVEVHRLADGNSVVLIHGIEVNPALHPWLTIRRDTEVRDIYTRGGLAHRVATGVEEVTVTVSKLLLVRVGGGGRSVVLRPGYNLVDMPESMAAMEGRNIFVEEIYDAD